jgi:hypothetical protein
VVSLSVSLSFEGIEENAAFFEELPEKVLQRIREKLQEIAPDIEIYTKSTAPVGKTGAYQNSILCTVDDLTLTLSAGCTEAPYAPIVEWGSAPHEIIARNAKALHWTDEAGQERFAKRVFHPGTQGQFIIQNAMAVKTEDIYAAIDEALDEATQEGGETS